mgnify:CR=1 FL=1
MGPDHLGRQLSTSAKGCIIFRKDSNFTQHLLWGGSIPDVVLILRSRGERAAAPGDGGLFLQTGAATAGGLSWATAAAVRERGAEAAAAPVVTATRSGRQEPGSAQKSPASGSRFMGEIRTRL